MNINLEPAHLGKIIVNFILHEHNQVSIAIKTQTLAALNTIQNYVNDMHQIMRASSYTVASISVTQAPSTAFNQQQQQQQSQDNTKHSSGFREQLSKMRSRKSKLDDNLKVYVSI